MSVCPFSCMLSAYRGTVLPAVELRSRGVVTVGSIAAAVHVDGATVYCFAS